MSETTSAPEVAQHPATSTRRPAPGDQHPAPGDQHRPRRRIRRIMLIAATAVLTLVAGGLVSGYVMANQLAGNVQRIPGVFTDVSTTGLSAAPGSETILVTGNDVVTPGTGRNSLLLPSGLIALVHLNAGRRTGAVVSIPPQTLAQVPGHGRMQLEDALAYGGPALLVRAVQGVTGIRIDHYAVVDFGRVSNVVNALGGVSVTVPRAGTSLYGVRLYSGVNHLNGTAALAYVRQPSLTEDQRVARQQNLLRAILAKIAGQDLLGHPLRSYGIVRAFTRALSVDSNFSNRELMSLATSARSFGSGSGTFVTAPVQPATRVNGRIAATLAPASGQLWHAIGTDSVKAFAQQHPATVTSIAPR